MKISDSKPGTGIEPVKKATEADRARKTGEAGSSESDSVLISNKAREMSRVKKILESVPEVRQDKVDKIKGDIEDGTYKFDAKKVAEKMIDRAIKNVISSKD